MEVSLRRKPNLAQLKRINDLVHKIDMYEQLPGMKLGDEDSESKRAKIEEKRELAMTELRRLAKKSTQLPTSVLRILCV